MRLTSEWQDAGPIYTGPWTRPAQPLTFFFRRLAIVCRSNLLPQSARCTRSPPPASDQCGRKSIVSDAYRRTEEGPCTRPLILTGDLNDTVQAATTQLLLGPPGSETAPV